MPARRGSIGAEREGSGRRPGPGAAVGRSRGRLGSRERRRGGILRAGGDRPEGLPVTEELGDIKDIVRAAYDAQAARYGAHTRLQSANLDHLIARLSAAAGGRPRGRWLDVGCGTGILAERLRQGGFAAPEHDARAYVGVDLSPEMIA
ncbi:MAG: class I SAM-dependent methyltransferase, partial [Deltaproteobacteria bacterium]